MNNYRYWTLIVNHGVTDVTFDGREIKGHGHLLIRHILSEQKISGLCECLSSKVLYVCDADLYNQRHYRVYIRWEAHLTLLKNRLQMV